MSDNTSGQHEGELNKTWHWIEIWRRFTEPAAAVREADRHRARLLSALLAFVIPLGVLSIFITLFDPNLTQRPEQRLLLVLIASALIFLSGAYALSRSSYYELAAWLTVGITVASILGGVSINHAASDLAYLIISILIASLFFSWRGTALVLGVTLGGILVLLVFVPELSGAGFVHVPYFVAIVGVLAMVSAAIQQQGREQVEERSRALNQAREELATRVQQRIAELAQANQALQAKITEHQQMEDVLRGSEERYRMLAESAQDTIFIVDREQRIHYINHSGATRFGVRPEETVGKTLAQLSSPQAADGQWGDVREVCESGESSSALEKVTYLGREAWMETRLIPLSVRDGEVRSVMGISRDITERKRADEELQRTNKQLETLLVELEQLGRETTLLREIGDLFQACCTAEEAHAVIRQSVQRLFACESGTLYVFNASRDLVEAAAFWGESPPSLPMFKPDACWALRRGKMHVVEESGSTIICGHLKDFPHAASLCVPMMAQGDVLGILTLTGSAPVELGAPRFTESKQQLAVTVTEHIALALANLKLQEMLRHQAIRDSLTNLYNRRYLEETLERELSRVKRRGAPLGIVMLDIDHFKRFNDTFGHDAGDIVLRELGRFLQSRMREEDIACRYGGEEFTLVFPETSLDTVQQRSEEIRAAVKQLNVLRHGQVLGTITLSMGVSLFPEHGTTSAELLKTADNALYRAKGEGRDRVVTGAVNRE